MMGNYQQLKSAIAAVIKTNGNNEITGALLQQVLIGMTTQIGSNMTLRGIATPATQPATPDQNCFYLATEAGTYANFDGRELDGTKLAIFFNSSGAWRSWVLPLTPDTAITHVISMPVGGRADYTADDAKSWNDAEEIVLLKYGNLYLSLSSVETVGNNNFALFSGIELNTDDGLPHPFMLTLDGNGYATYTYNQPIDYMVTAEYNNNAGLILGDKSGYSIIQAVINNQKQPVLHLVSTNNQLPLGIFPNGQAYLPYYGFDGTDAHFGGFYGWLDDGFYSVVATVHDYNGQNQIVVDLYIEDIAREIWDAISQKQDALVSGTNIKTVNGTSVLGSGNIDTQEIYVIPSAYILQIQTAAGTGENTPTLSTAYADIYNAIRGGKQLVCDLSETDAAPKRYVATECYAASTKVAFTFAPFDTEGSVFKRYQIQTNNNRSLYIASVAEFKGDSAPTASSSNYVTSGGVKTALDTKQDTLVSGTNIKTLNSASLLGSGDLTLTTEGVVIVNDLTTGGANAALSAEQGKVLGQKVNDVDNVPTAGSDNLVKSEGISKYLLNNFIVGANNTRKSTKIYNLIGGHKYQFEFVTLDWDRSGVTFNPGAATYLLIRSYYNNTATELVSVLLYNNIQKSYILTLPENVDYLDIATFATAGEKVRFQLLDVDAVSDLSEHVENLDKKDSYNGTILKNVRPDLLRNVSFVLGGINTNTGEDVDSVVNRAKTDFIPLQVINVGDEINVACISGNYMAAVIFYKGEPGNYIFISYTDYYVTQNAAIPSETTAIRLVISSYPDSVASLEPKLGLIDIVAYYNSIDSLYKGYKAAYDADNIILDEVYYAANHDGIAAVPYVVGSLGGQGQEVVSTFGNRVRTDFIPVELNNAYSVTNADGYACEIYQYDSNKTFLRSSGYITSITGSFNTGNDVSYIRVLIRKNPDSVLPINTRKIPYPVIKKQGIGVTVHKNPLKIAQWNVGVWNNGITPASMPDAQLATAIPELKGILTEIGADIFVMNEYVGNLNKGDEGEPVLNAYSTLLQQFYPYYVVGGTYIGVFSKYPFTHTEIDLTGDNRKALRLSVQIDTIIVDCIFLHATPYSAEERITDAENIAGLISNSPYAIVAGDLNTGNNSESDADILSQLTPYTSIGCILGNRGYWGVIPTYTTSGKSLDNIIVKGFNINNYKVLDEDSVSDHYPTFAEIDTVLVENN